MKPGRPSAQQYMRLFESCHCVAAKTKNLYTSDGIFSLPYMRNSCGKMILPGCLQEMD